MSQTNGRPDDTAYSAYSTRLKSGGAEPLGVEIPLKTRLKDVKQKIQAIRDTFEYGSYNDFTDYSIGIFERLVRDYFLYTVNQIPDEKAINYIGAKEAALEALREAKKYLSLALVELGKIDYDKGDEEKLYDHYKKCIESFEKVLRHWDIPKLPRSR